MATDENGGRFHFTTFNFDNAVHRRAGSSESNVGNRRFNRAIHAAGCVLASGNTGIAISNVSRTWFHGVYLAGRLEGDAKTHSESGYSLGSAAPVTDRYNRQASFNYNAVNPISTAVGQNYLGELEFASSDNRGLTNTNYKNFAPRIGFAYQIMPKLVMRGGYGIFYPPSYRGTGPAPGFSSDTPYVFSNDGGLTPANTLEHRLSGGLVPVSWKFVGRVDQCGIP